MPGRIEGYEPLLAAALPLWKIKLQQIRDKFNGEKKEEKE